MTDKKPWKWHKAKWPIEPYKLSKEMIKALFEWEWKFYPIE